MEEKKVSSTGSLLLSEVLQEMNQEGNFSISVLTDRQGFPLAAASKEGEDPEMQSAVVALIQKTARQTENQLGMSETDEISLFDTQGNRLVCRPFSVNGRYLILAVQMPDRNQPYRRLTNKAIREIQRAWKL